MNNHDAGLKAQKGYRGMAMEGPIATWYSRITRSRIGEQRALAHKVADHVTEGGHILEVAPGPGYLSIGLARLGRYTVTALDISETFVKIGQQNAAEAGVQVDFQNGDATNMPFDPESFDFAVCVAAFKNFTQPAQVLRELHRVLKPGGTALISDLRRDATMKDIDEAVDAMKLSKPNALITRWIFRNTLLKRAYTQSEIEAFVSQTAFGHCDIQCDRISMEIWLEK